jgi:hypothetical protein
VYAYALNDGARILSNTRYGPLSITSMAWTPNAQIRLVLQLLIQLWPLWQLRRLGSHLETSPGISSELARRVRGLAHAILIYGTVGLALPLPTLHSIAAVSYVSLERFGAATSYLATVSCLCLYATARWLDESVQLKLENEAFI